MKKKKEIIFVFLFLILLNSFFIFAAPSAPINLVLEGISSADYDEGYFSVNWSSGDGDSETEYRIYIFQDESFLMVAPNTSETGYQVNGPSDAKYTFIVEALNGTSGSESRANSSGNVSINIDSIIPSLLIVNSSHNIYVLNSNTLSLSLYISDENSGISNSLCLVSVGGSETIIVPSFGWCNSSSISLSESSEGNQSVIISVNDSAGNIVSDESNFVYIDSTGPSITFTCSPSSVYLNENVVCNCSAVDVGVGVNESSFEFSLNPDTSELGTFTRTCTVSDLLGNQNNKNFDYTVAAVGAPLDIILPDTDTDSNVSWIYTYEINQTEFLDGYTQNLAAKRRIKAPIGSEEHSIGVLELNETHAKIEIASTPIEKLLGIGDSIKIDILDDGFYDIYVILNSIINNNTANLTVKNIREEISPTFIQNLDSENESIDSSENQTGLNNTNSDDKLGLFSKINKTRFFIFLGAGLLAIFLFVFIYYIFKNKNKIKIKPIKQKNSEVESSSQEYDTSQDLEDIQENSNKSEEINDLKKSDSVDNEKIKDSTDSFSENNNIDNKIDDSASSEDLKEESGSIASIIKSHPDTKSKPKSQSDALSGTLKSSKPVKTAQSQPVPKTKIPQQVKKSKNTKNLPLYKPPQKSVKKNNQKNNQKKYI